MCLQGDFDADDRKERPQHILLHGRDGGQIALEDEPVNIGVGMLCGRSVYSEVSLLATSHIRRFVAQTALVESSR
jgi:hypothetical protein